LLGQPTWQTLVVVAGQRGANMVCDAAPAAMPGIATHPPVPRPGRIKAIDKSSRFIPKSLLVVGRITSTDFKMMDTA